LPIRGLAAEPIPFELAQEGVLGGFDDYGTRCAHGDLVRPSPLQLAAIERPQALHEDVNLEGGSQVDEVEMGVAADGAPDGLFIQVEILLQVGHEGGNRGEGQVDDEIQIPGLPRDAMDRAREGAADVVRNAEIFQQGPSMAFLRTLRERSVDPRRELFPELQPEESTAQLFRAGFGVTGAQTGEGESPGDLVGFEDQLDLSPGGQVAEDLELHLLRLGVGVRRESGMRGLMRPERNARSSLSGRGNTHDSIVAQNRPLPPTSCPGFCTSGRGRSKE
jgi:hypothetical protein